MKDIVKKALKYATEKHNGQLRAFSHLPYITHPQFVSKIIEQLTKNSVLTAAALLHDVLEDTDATRKEIEEQFGETIASLVDELTNKKEERGDKEKKEYMYEKIRNLSPDAFTIKLADRFHNILFLETDCKTREQRHFLKWYYENTIYILKDIELHRTLTVIQKAILGRIRAVLDFLKIRYNLD
ncbi:MAG: bifunctional (p)ppGpp synthetase/guanosine-3',5'-bis(diphosphate) 3'-pyrophosphohydrolase [Spirochaetales bacterium]|nr:bifunctional (p)ppGpp synthetase/guanosine-3',5'-bis(diphosphate) 3'-pyrophosphohydrolase [Spirochaetales bacterium]